MSEEQDMSCKPVSHHPLMLVAMRMGTVSVERTGQGEIVVQEKPMCAEGALVTPRPLPPDRTST